MSHHRAFGQSIESLDVVVVDDAKPMQSILRSILLSNHVARVRAFDTAEAAMQSMIVEPPNLLITDWHMQPTDGLTLLRSMRRRQMGQVALVPAILITAHPTRALVEAALAAGTHFVVAKPLSPATLMKRIDFILRDARSFEIAEGAAQVQLEGQTQRIARERQRWMETTQAQLTAPPAAPPPPPSPPQARAVEDQKPQPEENLPDRAGRVGGFALPARRRVLAGLGETRRPGTGQAASRDA